jgi:hypothetical protein
MKKMSFVAIGVMVIALVYSFVATNAVAGDDVPEAGSHIIIRYIPMGKGSDIQIFSGNNQVEQISLTKEQEQNGISNPVIDLLNKYSDQGYTLVSTTAVPVGQFSSQITCFLKKK